MPETKPRPVHACASSVARAAYRVECAAARVECARVRDRGMGDALLAVEDGFADLDARFRELARAAAETIGDNPLTAISRDAQDTVRLASEQYGAALVARMRAWRKTGRSQATREAGGVSAVEAVPGLDGALASIPDPNR
jgi:hypothetical protein